ncbi:MAG: flagellar protein FlgN [Defluviitaleaceae bacterium]|nr:flagellar protein FlgN [Defluviitaleaceae bacterium]
MYMHPDKKGGEKMAGMIDQLTDVMNQQAERHTELHGLSLEERDAIIQNDIEQLQKLVGLKNILVSQNSRLEKQRIALVNDIAEVMGHKIEDITLSNVIDILKDQPEDQERLREAGTKLREAVTKLQDVNELNKSLLESSIEFVEYSLNALRSTLSPEPPEYPTQRPTQGGNDGTGTFNATR